MAKSIVIGTLGAVILAGIAVAVLDTVERAAPSRDHDRPRVAVARIGPDGTDRSFFGDDLRQVPVKGSRRYDLCVGELRVERPPTITSSMPTASCTVTRPDRRGPWRITTGGWQQCQAVCVKIRR